MLRKKQSQRPRSNFLISSYPPGTFIRTEVNTYYVLNESKRLPVNTDRILDSWNPNKVVETREDHPAVKRLKVGVPLKFRNGSLLYSHASGRMYLIVNGKLRHITNPDILDALGYHRSEAVWVSLDEINLHEKGEPLNA